MVLTAERVRYLFHYDKDTGVFTRLVTVMGYGAQKGKVAGYLDKTKGYLTIRVDGSLYLAHRLAFMHVEGRWPRHHIDHADRDGSNNRWANLREASVTQNHQNSRKYANNKSGFKGVTTTTTPNRWRATIVVDGKQLALGTFGSPEEAHLAYRAAAIKHFGEFARAE